MRSPDPGHDAALARSGEAPAALVPRDGSPYWTFYTEVADRQLAEWAPTRPSRILDVSGGARFAAQLVGAGHDVVHVSRALAQVVPDPGATGRLVPVVADARSLDWLADGCVDAVLAESRALSLCLAAEVVVADLRRVLRPGGRLLLVVDSLTLGLARLAEQGRWAELADVPRADVVLVPDAGDGPITRCYWPEELVALLEGVGLVVDWVRPRTVLTASAVEQALAQRGPSALPVLATTELALSRERAGESLGLHLVVSARRP